MTDPHDDLPPHDPLAEQAVLGACLQSVTAFEDVIQIIGPADFYRRAHQAVFEAIADLATAGQPVDHIVVADELARRGTLAKVGGAPYLHTCIAACTSAMSATWHADIVRAKAKNRRLIEAGHRIVQIGHASVDDEDIDRAVENARQVIDEVAQDNHRGATEFDLGTAMADLLEALESPAPPSLPTGLHDLDRALNGGFRPGQLIVAAARPGGGKSILGLDVGRHVAKQGRGVQVASLEMSRDECMTRLLAAEASVELSRLTSHELQEDDWHRISRESGRIAGWPLDINAQPTQTVTSIRARARDLGRQHPLGLIVVDYIQLMSSKGSKAERRDLEIGEFTRGLKLLAKELQVPVLALSQLNRGADDRRPILKDLRESGSIENDADVVILLHREPDAPADIDLIIAKQRQGPTTTVTCRWRGHYARIDSIASRHLEAV